MDFKNIFGNSLKGTISTILNKAILLIVYLVPRHQVEGAHSVVHTKKIT